MSLGHECEVVLEGLAAENDSFIRILNCRPMVNFTFYEQLFCQYPFAKKITNANRKYHKSAQTLSYKKADRKMSVSPQTFHPKCLNYSFRITTSFSSAVKVQKKQNHLILKVTIVSVTDDCIFTVARLVLNKVYLTLYSEN